MTGSARSVSPDGSLVAAGSLAGDAIVIEVATGDVLAKLDEHAMGVLALAWAPDGSTLAVGGQDGVVACYGRDGGHRVATIECGGWVADLAWHPAATRVDESATLAIAAAKSVTVVHGDGSVERSAAAASTVTAVAWSPDGRRVAGVRRCASR